MELWALCLRKVPFHFSKYCARLVLNIGNLNETVMGAMIIAGKAANENGVPVIFDPVGAGATSYRTRAAERIISEVKVDVVELAQKATKQLFYCFGEGNQSVGEGGANSRIE